MADEIDPRTRVSGEIRRIGESHLGKAADALRSVDRDPAAAVHEARKALKRQRALLRLTRPSAGRKAWRAEDRAVRDVGRGLSGQRDADVLRGSFDSLAERCVGQVPAEAFDQVRAALDARPGQPDGLAPGPLAEQAAEEVLALAARWEAFAPAPKRAHVLAGLRDTYRRGRRALRGAVASGDPAARHEWRKDVKALWNQEKLLRPLWPEAQKVRVAALDELGELLGLEHDLDVLRGVLQGELPGVTHDVTPLLAVLDDWRTELTASAVALGRRVYAERPAAYEARVRALWDAERERLAASGNTRSLPV